MCRTCLVCRSTPVKAQQTATPHRHQPPPQQQQLQQQQQQRQAEGMAAMPAAAVAAVVAAVVVVRGAGCTAVSPQTTLRGCQV